MIVGVAIKTPQGEIISKQKPNRHCDIMFETFEVDRWLFNDSEQGFIDENGSFLTRHEAYKYAIEVGQVCIKNLVAPPDLFSEDLW